MLRVTGLSRGASPPTPPESDRFATILRDLEMRFRQLLPPRIGEQACAVNVRVKYFVRLRTPEIEGLKSTR